MSIEEILKAVEVEAEQAWHGEKLAGNIVKEHFERGRSFAIREIRALLSQNPDPAPSPHMPGAWVCDKCGFTLQKNVLHMGDASMSADTSPLNNTCPNDGVLMRPLTWREVNENLFKMAVEKQTRLSKLESDVKAWMHVAARLRDAMIDGYQPEQCGQLFALHRALESSAKGEA